MTLLFQTVMSGYCKAVKCKLIPRSGVGREGPGVRTPQRRPVALVVIVQIQWLCQGGGGPAPWRFGPLDKNSWRRPCDLGYHFARVAY